MGGLSRFFTLSGLLANLENYCSHDIWQSLATGGPSPRTEMLYNVNPLTEDGQAGHPHAGLRVGDYKILCCEYPYHLQLRNS